MLLVEQIFAERVIPFPKELWQNKRGCPDAERLLLGITAAAMLFPREYECFAGYLAKELVAQAGVAENRLFDERISAFIERQESGNCRDNGSNVTSQNLMRAIFEGTLPQDKKEQAGLTDEWLFDCVEELESLYSEHQNEGAPVSLQDVMQAISEGSLLPEKEEQIDLMQAKFQRMLFGSPAIFQRHCGWRGFSENGKGSLAERIMQGRICGLICLSMALAGKSVSESITDVIPTLEGWRKESEEIQTVMPTISFKNIMNTIWPRFRDVAWLWSVLSIVEPEYDGQRLSLDTIRLYRNDLTEALEVHRVGWWGFMDCSVKIYDLLYTQEKFSSEQKSSLPWRFSFQLSEYK